MFGFRKLPLGDVLTYGFIVAVGLMWVFSDEIGINILTLIGLTIVAVVLVFNYLFAKRIRRKNDELKEKIKEVRENIGKDFDVDQKDKYYY